MNSSYSSTSYEEENTTSISKEQHCQGDGRRGPEGHPQFHNAAPASLSLISVERAGSGQMYNQHPGNRSFE
jgi:hypothetical protein